MDPNQDPSGTISTNQGLSGPIRVYQDLSMAIWGNPDPSGTINTHKELSGPIRVYQDPSKTIRDCQDPSRTIRTHQEVSGLIITIMTMLVNYDLLHKRTNISIIISLLL